MSKRNSKSVFLTDALLRKTLVTGRALGKQGIKVTIGGSSRLSPAFFSKHCHSKMLYPNPIHKPEAFVEKIVYYLKKHPHDVLLPTDDLTLLLLSEKRQELESIIRVPFPSRNTLEYGLDKSKATALVSTLGVPLPRTYYPKNAEDVGKIANETSAPLIIKPKQSSGARGIEYVGDKDLVDVWNKAHQEYPCPLVQEQIPSGTRYDVCVLMDHARPLASFAQKELRHYPLKDGFSTMQESIHHPELIERAVAILKEMGWHGLAEVEFMENPLTGEILFMEVNPRIWASIQLAISCGINFPYLLYQMATGERVQEIHRYETGVRCRWFFPGDVLHFLANPHRMTLNPPFFQFRDPKLVYDGIYADDITATLGVTLSAFYYLIDPDMWRIILRGRKR
jgi:predicted ATP-grasp superfamily ATP-dependent carboligase